MSIPFHYDFLFLPLTSEYFLLYSLTLHFYIQFLQNALGLTLVLFFGAVPTSVKVISVSSLCESVASFICIVCPYSIATSKLSPFGGIFDLLPYLS